MMYGSYAGCGYGMGYGFWHLLNFLFIALVTAFFVALFIRNRKQGHHSHAGDDKALDLLRERYVKGEIERVEFEQKKKDLTN